jgi:hypothetical protein
LFPGQKCVLSIPTGSRLYAKTSNSDPLFLPPLPSGNYLLVIEAPAFFRFSQQVTLKEDKIENLKAKLRISEATTGILIETDAPIVQTESTVSTTFERKMLNAPLPSNGPSRGGPSPLR